VKGDFKTDLSEAVARLWSEHGIEVEAKEILDAIENPRIVIGHMKIGGELIGVVFEDVVKCFVKEENDVQVQKPA